MCDRIRRRPRTVQIVDQQNAAILEEIQAIVLDQQSDFNRTWEKIFLELQKEKIFIVTEDQLNKEQQRFVQYYFEEEVRANIIPLMIESIPQFPYLRDKSIYLGVVLSRNDGSMRRKYALIEVPSKALGRFIRLPSSPGEHHIILLEDTRPVEFPPFEQLKDRVSQELLKQVRDKKIEELKAAAKIE